MWKSDWMDTLAICAWIAVWSTLVYVAPMYGI